MRAVIVDDSPRMRAELRQLLNRLGWTVVGEGENGIEALELIRNLQPDFLTLDIIMPEMDGIECYRHLRQLLNPPRCLLVSVLAAEPRVLAAYAAEIYPTHFLKKPVTEKELREKIDLLMKMPVLPVPPAPEIADAINRDDDEGPLPPLPPLPPSASS